MSLGSTCLKMVARDFRFTFLCTSNVTVPSRFVSRSKNLREGTLCIVAATDLSSTQISVPGCRWMDLVKKCVFFSVCFRYKSNEQHREVFCCGSRCYGETDFCSMKGCWLCIYSSMVCDIHAHFILIPSCGWWDWHCWSICCSVARCSLQQNR
jgi:hypothetical protein